MIIAGESSGELYGALLTKAIRSLWPRVKVIGVGGERMKEAGALVFAEVSSAFGLLEAVSAFRKVKMTFNKTIDMMKRVMPDVLILIDYPDFNLRVARVAKKLGIKVLYYVSPQVWAWRKGRIKTIGKLVDKIAVILPFEEAIYKRRGIPCEFVGHPIYEEIESSLLSTAREELGIKEGTPVLSVLPGSRPNELDRLLPVLICFVRMFKKEYPNYHILLPFAPNLDIQRYRTDIREFEAEGVQILFGGSIFALSASDMAVIASGTATLQASFLETPMVVIYKVSPISYPLGRLIIKVKHISLVNLLLERLVVPELIQRRANAKNIMIELRRLMSDKSYRDGMISAFRELKNIYSEKKPSLRVAEIVGEIAGWQGQ
ncbi:MAG: lipid-A-disaccharide synthase [Nitrospirae bacterium]|nr:lipid-A-disaccharide synthase [Nitrospirota bacterium]